MGRHAARIAVVCALALAMGGCGFHLRGTGGYEFRLDKINVSATNAYGEMQRELERALVQAGAELVDGDGAPYSVRLLREQNTRRPVATSSDARVAEYELRLEVTFELVDDSGQTVIPATPVFAERIYRFDNTSLVGSSEEENLLTGEMRRDVAAQLIRRIDASIRSQQGAS